jgi:hypothetical protein
VPTLAYGVGLTARDGMRSMSRTVSFASSAALRPRRRDKRGSICTALLVTSRGHHNGARGPATFSLTPFGCWSRQGEHNVQAPSSVEGGVSQQAVTEIETPQLLTAYSGRFRPATMKRCPSGERMPNSSLPHGSRLSSLLILAPASLARA